MKTYSLLVWGLSVVAACSSSPRDFGSGGDAGSAGTLQTSGGVAGTLGNAGDGNERGGGSNAIGGSAGADNAVTPGGNAGAHSGGAPVGGEGGAQVEGGSAGSSGDAGQAGGGGTSSNQPLCGNGVVDASEVCDDGKDNGKAHRCDGDCGFVCNGPCPIRVNLRAPLGGDGTSWAQAYRFISYAVDTAKTTGSKQIWIAEGVYTSREGQIFVLEVRNQSLEVYGGFAGTEKTFNERNPAQHPTILDGASARAVVVMTAEAGSKPPPVVRLDGLTIRNGKSYGFGGAWLSNVVPTIANSVFENNEDLEETGFAASAGALRIEPAGAVTITNSVFKNNVSDRGSSAVNVKDMLDFDITITGSTFSNNRRSPQVVLVNNGTQGSMTSSVFSENDSPGLDSSEFKVWKFQKNKFEKHPLSHALSVAHAKTTLDDCDFTENQGAFTWGEVGGNTTLAITNSRFVDNNGTGFSMNGPRVTISDSLFKDNGTGVFAADGYQPSLLRNRFSGNTRGVSKAGAGRFAIVDSTFDKNDTAVYFHGDQLTLDNCQFSHNKLALDMGSTSTFEAQLCSFVEDTSFFTGSPSATSGPWKLYNSALWPVTPVASNFFVVQNSCFKAATATNKAITKSPFVAKDVDADGISEYHLDQSSACVNAGNNTLLTSTTWQAQSTSSTGCLDSGNVDAGKHFAPGIANPPACK